MSSSPVTPIARILLTGVTGFLGKVVLETLLRQSQQDDSFRVYALIRGKGRKSAKERFESAILESRCFQHLPKGWQKQVVSIEGDLSQPDLGLSEPTRQQLQHEITHIIHCAASVDFVLPVEQASVANIDAALYLMSLAHSMPHLQRFVTVSTAYVSKYKSGPVPEQLAELALDAQVLYDKIKSGELQDPAILNLSGHPNTYTLTKSIAEHLLVRQRKHVSLSIVRPSVISASYQYPEPGWIDSNAALAAFVSLIGTGALRVVDGDPNTKLDVVPVDWVAECIVKQMLAPLSDPYNIIHAVATPAHALQTKQIQQVLNNYFGRYHVGRSAKLVHLGRRDATYMLQDMLEQRGPSELLQRWFRFCGKTGKASRLRRMLQQVQQINHVFPYFTSHTFAFESSVKLPDDFVAVNYMNSVCRGVFQHLLRGKPDAMDMLTITPDQVQHYKKTFSQPHGNWALRIGSLVLDHVLPKMFSQVTFDQESFESAVQSVPAGASLVLLPNHRSYVDFLLVSYLCFQKETLGIAPPFVAAAKEFQQLPGLGWLMEKMHAFYIQRGQGSVDSQLNGHIAHLLSSGKVLEFFLEGQRSRTRHFLTPKRGLLRAVEQTGHPCYFLPICFTYDRIPEEQAYVKELQSWRKPPMRMQDLWKWLLRLERQEINLGRVHMRCGRAIALAEYSCMEQLSQHVVASLQELSACTTFHLRMFLSEHANVSYTLDELCAMVEQHGMKVLDSNLQNDDSIDPLLRQTLQNQWSWIFLADACIVFPQNMALQTELATLLYGMPTKAPSTMRRSKMFRRFLHSLFSPVCRDYERFALAIAEHLRVVKSQYIAIESLVKQLHWSDPTSQERALKAMTQQKLVRMAGDMCQLLATPEHFISFAQACQLEQESAGKASTTRSTAVVRAVL